MIAIVDYGAGNLFSVKNALDFLNEDCIITNDKNTIENCDKIILPGVGAFPSAMKMLTQSGLKDFLIEQSKKKYFLGICLGMQMLFDKSFEFEETKGLSLINGSVDKIQTKDLVIPHMGWNKLEKLNDCPIMKDIGDNEYVYFVHSYRAFCLDDNISAYCNYGEKIPALVFKDNVFGAQFHPEKSGNTGLCILKNFSQLN